MALSYRGLCPVSSDPGHLPGDASAAMAAKSTLPLRVRRRSWSPIVASMLAAPQGQGPAKRWAGSLPLLTQPCQHFQTGVAVGGLEPGFALVGAHRKHCVAADASVRAVGIEAERSEA